MADNAHGAAAEATLKKTVRRPKTFLQKLRLRMSHGTWGALKEPHGIRNLTGLQLRQSKDWRDRLPSLASEIAVSDQHLLVRPAANLSVKPPI